MNLILNRILVNENGCFGNLHFEGNAIFSAVTLERVEEGLEAEKGLRVPPGEYSLIRHDSPKFPHTYKLYNDQVPASREILIHIGNYLEDTNGCILLASSANGMSNATMILGSKSKYEQFRKIMDLLDLKETKLIIKNKF